MKLNISFLAFLSAILTFSCAPDIDYREINEFQITEGYLEANQKVALMYASATPDNEEILSYFIHAVGIVQESGDTVNILTPYNRGAGDGDSKNIFKFYPISSEEGSAYFEETINKEGELDHKISEIDVITRVSFDKRFNYIAQNNFPTIIGFLDK